MLSRENPFRKCAFRLLSADALRTIHRMQPVMEEVEAEVASENNPTLRRRQLGFLLRKLRTERGLSIREVTERAMFSATKLSRLETGRVGASPRDIRDLCIVYGITDPAERDRLMTLAREGKQRAWWQQFDLPYVTYVG
jgi:hypothetical protein